MSGYINHHFTASCVDLHFVRIKVQESLDNGVDDDETSISELVRYYISDVQKIEVGYMRPCRLYSVKFATVDALRNEYQYRFFVKSQRSM